jgi:long-chain acyl-CoA synthetase
MDGLISQPPAPNRFELQPFPAGDILERAVVRFGALPALDFLGRKWTYKQLGDLANRAAAGLQKLGVMKGVNVGLCLPNSPYYVIMYFAILKAGGTVVNFNPLYTEHEIRTQAEQSHTAIMVSMDLRMIHEKIRPLAGDGLFKRVVICRMARILTPRDAILFRLFKGRELSRVANNAPYVPFERLLDSAALPGAVEIDPLRDVAVMQFTGGTTGRPKAAMLTHANVTANVQQLLATLNGVREGEERSLAVLPFFHVFAMTAIMNLGLSCGAELLLIPRPEIKLITATIRRCRPTVLTGVPTLFTALSAALEADTHLSLASVRNYISGGAPLSAEILDRFERLTQSEILEGYGLSECSPVVASSTPGAVRHGAAGRALPGTVIEIRNPEAPHNLLDPGALGEICVRGPQVMAGYYHQPEETAQVFIEGALRTGDIGYVDKDGYLFIVDRIKDLIICGGYNVYPRMIEEAAYLHPAVQDAIAIGVPDPYRGERPKLFVALRPGKSAEPAEILKFLETYLNKIEIPREVEIRDSLPKTLIGKLSKKELVAEERQRAA